MTKPLATVREENGQLILDDPEGAAMLRAVAKHNCGGTLKAHQDRVDHFARRIQERGDDPKDVVIVLIYVDDTVLTHELAHMLMPEENWQTYRDRGEAPFARGLAARDGIQEVLEITDMEAARKLMDIEGPACVVFDHKTVEVFRV